MQTIDRILEWIWAVMALLLIIVVFMLGGVMLTALAGVGMGAWVIAVSLDIIMSPFKLVAGWLK